MHDSKCSVLDKDISHSLITEEEMNEIMNIFKTKNEFNYKDYYVSRIYSTIIFECKQCGETNFYYP